MAINAWNGRRGDCLDHLAVLAEEGEVCCESGEPSDDSDGDSLYRECTSLGCGRELPKPFR